MIGRLAAASGVCAAALVGAVVEWRAARPAGTWALVDALGATDYLRAIPANALVLAPNLADGHAAAADGGDRYLSDYFSALAGHPLRVVHAWPDAASQGGAVYYCEHEWLAGRRAAVLLIGRMLPPSADGPPFAGDRLTVVSTVDLRRMAVEYGAAGGGTREATVGPWRREGAAFVADAEAPGWMPGTTRLVDEETGNAVQAAVALDFGHGFSEVTERADGHYFRWSDGADGKAEIDLVNSLDRPLTVRFRAALRFHAGAKTGAFDLTTAAGKESFRVDNGGAVERVWTLAPGSNRVTILCHEARIPAPGDVRQIVFGLWDWTVTPVPPK